MTPRLGIEPGPHWWEASALTTAPSPHPHSFIRVRDTFKTDHMTTTEVILGGLTKTFQQLAISVNCQSFKNQIREGIQTFTEIGKMGRATHSEVCHLVISAWKAVMNIFPLQLFQKGRNFRVSNHRRCKRERQLGITITMKRD